MCTKSTLLGFLILPTMLFSQVLTVNSGSSLLTQERNKSSVNELLRAASVPITIHGETDFLEAKVSEFNLVANNLNDASYSANLNNETLNFQNEFLNGYIKVYPNPTTDKLFIKSPDKVRSELFNKSNQKVLKSYDHVLYVSDLPNGTYFLRITNSKNEKYTFKILKK